MTENRRGLPTASATAKAIRTRILEQTGLTASAGISYNKFLAKLAYSQRKPNGQFVITPEMGPDFVASLPVNKFHGVGPVTAAKMQSLGIRRGRGSVTAVSAGRSKIRAFTTIEGAQAQVYACLRKRATAPRRIGVAYRVCGRTRCEQWCQPDPAGRISA